MFFIPNENKRLANETELRAHFSNVSFPAIIDNAELVQFGVFPLYSVKPEYDAETQKLVDSGVELIDGKYQIKWQIEPLDQETIDLNKHIAWQKLINEYDKALTDYLDSIAAIRRYDNRISCAVRAGYPGPYQEECQAFGTFMDQCNEMAYQLLNDITIGVRPMFNSTQEFIDILPKFTWPTKPLNLNP